MNEKEKYQGGVNNDNFMMLRILKIDFGFHCIQEDEAKG